MGSANDAFGSIALALVALSSNIESTIFGAHAVTGV